MCKLSCNFVGKLKENVDYLYKLYIIILPLVVLSSCKKTSEDDRVVAPWGEVKEREIPTDDAFSLQDILNGGEMIMLTMSSPNTYYDYHGRGMGMHYLLCEKFSQKLGVSLRVELCKDTLEMLDKLKKGTGDVIAFPLPDSLLRGDTLVACGYRMKGDGRSEHWAVGKRNAELVKALEAWFSDDMIAAVKNEEKQLLNAPKVHRKVFSPFLNRSGGVISKYDALFQKYAPRARWDWRLMAAQCYQESCFDPNARSWAGAQGLMQIMPKTAEHLGISQEKVCDPETNIKGAAQLIAELSTSFSDIPNSTERQLFVLASYNGGSGHVRDAMALCRKQGGNPHSWNDVSRALLLLRDPQYYNDPVVKYGYIRSTETVDYVERIRQRYAQYRGVPIGKLGTGSSATPRPATKRHKYHI
ncbi:MAG: transglycosylase SLT domain-containing protein [Prevotella sp.]|nr:transglycosylase SLT domain-containing protein [Prevotella sp.]